MSKISVYTIKWLIMIVIFVFSIFPITWMILGSFRPHEEIFKYTSLSWHMLVPVQWTLKNYHAIFTDSLKPIGRYLMNTLAVAVTVTVFSVFFNSMAAFAFAKLRFPLKKIIFPFFLSALVIPTEVTLVPSYLLMHNFGWVNTYYALVVPAIISVFSVFMLTQFFSEIPTELLEAGRIDGASWMIVYRVLVLPASVPALITVAIITFLGQWDAYLWPLIVINDEKMQMLQVMIATFSSLLGIEWAKILAADTISSIPILILFLFVQKYYIQGITMTGVKG
jgi:multiple sugar transport system permease protein